MINNQQKTFQLGSNKSYIFIEFGTYSTATSCFAIIYTGTGRKKISELYMTGCSLAISNSNVLTFTYTYGSNDSCAFALLELY